MGILYSITTSKLELNGDFLTVKQTVYAKFIGRRGYAGAGLQHYHGPNAGVTVAGIVADVQTVAQTVLGAPGQAVRAVNGGAQPIPVVCAAMEIQPVVNPKGGGVRRGNPIPEIPEQRKKGALLRFGSVGKPNFIDTGQENPERDMV